MQYKGLDTVGSEIEPLNGQSEIKRFDGATFANLRGGQLHKEHCAKIRHSVEQRVGLLNVGVGVNGIENHDLGYRDIQRNKGGVAGVHIDDGNVLGPAVDRDELVSTSGVPEEIEGGRKAPTGELIERGANLRPTQRIHVTTRHHIEADQIVRGTVVLPHGTGKEVRVLVIAQGEKEAEAREAGADYVGVEFADKIKQGWLEFDVAVATPDMMGKVGPLGRILGPRGLMPTPKAGTVTFDVGRAVEEIKAGKIEFRVDKLGNVHAPIGRVSFSEDQLKENLGAFMDQIVRAKPSAAKGTYVRSVTVSSTMGPGVSIDTNLFRRA